VIRVQRARILLAYRESLSFFAVGHAVGVHRQTVQRCVERAAVEGPMAALDDRPAPGKAPTITAEAKAWISFALWRVPTRERKRGHSGLGPRIV
jgi:Winged helix-turn helix